MSKATFNLGGWVAGWLAGWLTDDNTTPCKLRLARSSAKLDLQDGLGVVTTLLKRVLISWPEIREIHPFPVLIFPYPISKTGLRLLILIENYFVKEVF